MSAFRFSSLFSFVAALLLSATSLLAGINTFTANPTAFLPGQEITLSWSVTAGDVIAINQGVGTVTGTTGSVKVIPSGLTTYTLTDSTSGTTSQVTATPMILGLRNRWSFSEASGTAVNDSIGAATATIKGSPFSRASGQVTLSGGSSASAAYIDLPNGLISSLTDVTLEGWMTVTNSQSWARILDFGRTNQTSAGGATGELTAPGSPSGNTTGTDYILLSAQVGGDQSLRRIALRDNTATEQGTNFSDPITNGQQFHFALVFDSLGNNGSPQVRYYKNGVLVGTQNTTVTLANIEDVNNWLGRSNYTGDLNLAGSYNEFRLWTRALSASAIAETDAAGPDALPQSINIESFTAFPSTAVYAGQSARLSYVLSNPSGGGFTATVDQGIGALAGTSGYVTVNPLATTTYTITIVAGANTRTAQVTIAVIPNAWFAENLSVVARYQTATPVTLIAYDSNPSAVFTYTIVTPPAHGTLSGTAPNLTYTPAANYSGPDSFTYKGTDGGDSNIATVSIVVNSAPLPPASLSLNELSLYTELAGGSFAGRFKAVDPNPDDTFTYALVSGPGSTNNSYFSIIGNQLVASHNFASDLNQTISIRVRVTDSAGNSIEQVIALPVTVRPLHVKVNEINYNPARNTQLSEFIELYNPTAAAVDLSNWRLAKGLDYIFPSGASIPAGGYLVIAGNPVTIQALYGVTALGPWTGGLSSDGDNIELQDGSGSVVDKVSYGNTAPWPAPPNGEGPTLELLNPTLDGNSGGNWRASTTTQTAISYVAAGSSGWHYRKGTSEASTPITAWRAAAFTEDASWLNATLPIGLFKLNNNNPLATIPETGITLATQLTDMATYVASNVNSGTNFSYAYRSVFLRKTFTVSGPVPRSVLLRVMHDDAAIVWINGVEVARFGFYPGAPTDPTYNNTAYYELANDPWSETVLLNAPALLQQGNNIICVEGFAKPPQIRSTQDDLNTYNLSDFAVDAELKSSPDVLGTPGAQNSVFTATPPPAVDHIAHSPKTPKPWEAITVTASVSDPRGVGSVQLKYQVNAPGAYIPSTLPLTVAQLLANPTQNLPANPAFESTGWTTLTMVDDGSVAGDIPGDGIFTARIPAQPHRTLVRYRIVATDLGGASVTVPTGNDPRKNFAFFVYNRVPNYISGSQVFSTTTLNTLPVYQWIMRPQDVTSLMAYSAADQFPNTADLNVLLSRRYENFAGTLVVGDQVLDHVHTRLRGGNSRYAGSGKRHLRFNFAKGTVLAAADEFGRKYNRPWDKMLFNKMFGNKGYYDWGLPYEVGGKIWTQQGVPIPNSHWVHFRVIQNANEADAALGDFWGMYQALEFPDGRNFLRERSLPLGNFYKMSDWTQNGEMETRYQAAGAVDFAEDFDNIRYNMHQCTSQSDLERYTDIPKWYRYDAVKEAIRHYDIFSEPTGRHRSKNLIWYFQPKENTNGLGQMLEMPYDWDATFGPNWNSGYDFIHNALYDHADIPDSPTWTGTKIDRTAMRIEHRNVIRELRDLVFYRDGTGRGPVDDILDDAAATMAAFAPADMARWPAPGAQTIYANGVAGKVADMKAFCFTGWSDTAGNGDPSVPAGGRVGYLDTISDSVDAGLLPAKPTISYSGTASYPVDAISFTSTAFSDPQGSATTGAAVQWRIGEITDPTAPGYDPTAERIYEAVPVYDSTAVTPFGTSISIPGTMLKVGHTYRARVRHRDNTGRFGHWSAPLQFTTSTSNYLQTMKDNLMVSEVMYHPAAPGAGYVESDYEYLELTNISPSLTLDLSNVRITKGVDFDFAGSAVTSLLPGEHVLVVRNIAAFVSRYGTGKLVAGQWVAGGSLSNSGEEVKISYGAGLAIQDFTYSDSSPWPAQADAGGYSLVLRAPEMRPDHTIGNNWRASYVAGGSPGGSDRQTYAEWTAANAASDPLADDDFDGVSNGLEYAFGGSNTTMDRSRLPIAAVQSVTVGASTDNYLTLAIRRPYSSDQAAIIAEWSLDLSPSSWAATGALMSRTDNGDGTQTEVWRAPAPTSVSHYFGRAKVTLP